MVRVSVESVKNVPFRGEAGTCLDSGRSVRYWQWSRIGSLRFVAWRTWFVLRDDFAVVLMTQVMAV